MLHSISAAAAPGPPIAGAFRSSRNKRGSVSLATSTPINLQLSLQQEKGEGMQDWLTMLPASAWCMGFAAMQPTAGS